MRIRMSHANVSSGLSLSMNSAWPAQHVCTVLNTICDRDRQALSAARNSVRSTYPAAARDNAKGSSQQGAATQLVVCGSSAADIPAARPPAGGKAMCAGVQRARSYARQRDMSSGPRLIRVMYSTSHCDLAL